ncbi:B-cell receptor-associated 31-like protein [Prunus dulcis]|uniref:B-cell receptor-associated 31-like protein n=1 Tax=Prunus dulcis TaxID=3755 RepID=A0A4Y1RDD6_PRUDU|nr:B-cell receptor-associated 31-like protein [Prunus dulcis]
MENRSKQGRGPLVAKSVGGTVLVFFSSTLYGVFSVQKRLTEAGFVNPTDEVLMAHRLLEASLIDRLHCYIKELNLLRKFNEEVKNVKNDYEQRKNADAEMKKQRLSNRNSKS